MLCLPHYFVSCSGESFSFLDESIDALTKQCVQELKKQGFKKYVRT